MHSIINQIEKTIKSWKRGRFIFPKDFEYLGNQDSVRKALQRLTISGLLYRVALGVYYYPKIDKKWGMGVLLPGYEEIANAVAKREKIRIIPIGAYSLNKLGLSTQVPANVVFLTDGISRKIAMGKGKGIRFIHTTDMKWFAYKSDMMLLCVSSMRELGEKNITEEQLALIIEYVQKVPNNLFQDDVKLAPAWVRKMLML